MSYVVPPRAVDRADAATVRAAVCRLPGVLDAEVALSADGALDSLTTSVTIEADEAEVARRLDAMLRATFGLRLDATRITVVEESDAERGPTGRPGAAHSARVSVTSLRISADVTAIRADVTLRWGDVEFVGSATAPASGDVHRVTARAVVAGLASRFHGVHALDLEVTDVRPVRLGDYQAMVVAVHTSSGQLVGSSGVRGCAGQATVRACLDALNRVLETVRP